MKSFGESQIERKTKGNVILNKVEWYGSRTTGWLYTNTIFPTKTRLIHALFLDTKESTKQPQTAAIISLEPPKITRKRKPRSTITNPKPKPIPETKSWQRKRGIGGTNRGSARVWRGSSPSRCWISSCNSQNTRPSSQQPKNPQNQKKEGNSRSIQKEKGKELPTQARGSRSDSNRSIRKENSSSRNRARRWIGKRRGVPVAFGHWEQRGQFLGLL